MYYVYKSDGKYKGVCACVFSAAVFLPYDLLANKLCRQPSAFYIADVLLAQAEEF